MSHISLWATSYFSFMLVSIFYWQKNNVQYNSVCVTGQILIYKYATTLFYLKCMFLEIRPTDLSQNQKQQTQSDVFPRKSFEICYIEILPYQQLQLWLFNMKQTICKCLKLWCKFLVICNIFWNQACGWMCKAVLHPSFLN